MILDRILAAALGVSILVAGASLWFADHERGKIAPLQNKVTAAQHDAAQSAADRDAALQAANDARAQLKAAQTAFVQAASAAQAASSAAASARAKLSAITADPTTAKVMGTAVPTTVWDAIYNPTPEK